VDEEKAPLSDLAAESEQKLEKSPAHAVSPVAAAPAVDVMQEARNLEHVSGAKGKKAKAAAVAPATSTVAADSMDTTAAPSAVPSDSLLTVPAPSAPATSPSPPGSGSRVRSSPRVAASHAGAPVMCLFSGFKPGTPYTSELLQELQATVIALGGQVYTDAHFVPESGVTHAISPPGSRSTRAHTHTRTHSRKRSLLGGFNHCLCR